MRLKAIKFTDDHYDVYLVLPKSEEHVGAMYPSGKANELFIDIKEEKVLEAEILRRLME